MKELIVLSGKGGTGKTSLTSALADLSQHKVLCDADVDAADLFLIMNPNIKQTHIFQSGHTAVINPEKCTQCGLCIELCRFEAINQNFVVDSISCEGCGVCVFCCPEHAVDFPVNNCGHWFISDTRFGPMVHARLGIAQENSGKLVTLVRKQARMIAQEKGLNLILTDGPPGVGCPVIASMGGADAVIIVTEPTVSGLHDMERVLKLAEHFTIPAMVCVNKYDLNPEISRQIETHSKSSGAVFLGKIPFDPVLTQAMIHAQTVLEYASHSNASASIREIWNNINEAVLLS